MEKGYKRTENVLRIENDYLKQVFESAEEAIVMCDNDDKILHINNAFSRLFGYEPEEARGRFIDDLVVAEGVCNGFESICGLASESIKRKYEGVSMRKDGVFVHVSAIVSPLIIDNERMGSYAIFSDLTRHKEL